MSAPLCFCPPKPLQHHRRLATFSFPLVILNAFENDFSIPLLMIPCDDDDDDDGYHHVSVETLETLHFQPLHIPGSCMYMRISIIPTLQGSTPSQYAPDISNRAPTAPSEASLIRALKREMHSTIHTLMLQDVPDRFCL